jgi:hypothetical protein
MHILGIMIVFLALFQVPLAAQPPEYLNVLQVQVMLDRAGFSPGVIDGHMDANTKKALAIFRNQGIQEQAVEPVTRYRITAEDVAGPFVTIPSDMMQKASLPALGYTLLLEAIAERFHSTPTFLQQLNPDTRFVEGEEIEVPNVEAMVIPILPSKPSLEKPPDELMLKATPALKAVPAKPDVVVTVTNWFKSGPRNQTNTGLGIFPRPFLLSVSTIFLPFALI